MVDRLTAENVNRGDLLFAALAGITGVVGSYAVAGASPRFVVAPIDALVVRLTPGGLIAWLIVNVGDPAHLLHISLSVVIAAGLFAGAALLGVLVSRRTESAVLGIGVTGLLAWVVTFALTTAPRLALGAAIPVALFTALGTTPPTQTGHDPSRRRVLAAGATAFAFITATVGADLLPSGGDEPAASASSDSEVADTDVAQLLEQAEVQSLDIAGDTLPGLVSAIGDFYNVDINQYDPEYSTDEWDLLVTGDVEEDVEIDFAQLTDMPVEHRFVTLRCVGESLNGRKMDTALWTGTPLKPLLERADPTGACGCAMLYAKDDYFVQFPLAALENGFLAWRMNGKPLPQSHGHPVRVLIPGHWGETNVKWLNEIELLDEELDGYWEQRGWHGTGPVNTVAKLWSDTMLEDGRIEVAGHAYAGTRGISAVEVSVDGGETWTDTELSEPLPGDDVWRQWRHVFEPDGTHEVVVRAIDGEGTMQPREQSESFPSGATGWVSKSLP